LTTKLSGARLLRGEEVRGLTIDGLHLDDCHTELGPPDELRPIISDCAIRNLRLTGSTLQGCMLRDLTIDGVKGDSGSRFFFGNYFERVVLKGRVQELTIGNRPPYPPLADAYVGAIRSAEAASDEWSLDISQVVGPVGLRGYSADRLRLDPDTQLILRRADLADHRWKPLVAGTTFTVVIEQALENDWPDIVLTADKSSRQLEKELAALQLLRAEEVAK